MGTRETIREFSEHNEKLDASKERDRKNKIEQQVSNSYLSGVRGGLLLDGCNFLDKMKEGKVKPPSGKYKFGVKEGKSIMVSWPSYLTPEEVEIARVYYNCAEILAS